MAKKKAEDKNKEKEETKTKSQDNSHLLGNQFWKLRSKHGRDKLFATPELLWEAACEYFQWCDDNPLTEQKLFSFQGAIVEGTNPLMRAYTLKGLCLYLDCNEAYFRVFKSQLPDGEVGFNTVIARIEDTIYNQKFSGAAAGLLNANIIARDLGLVDKVENEVKSQTVQTFLDQFKDVQ